MIVVPETQQVEKARAVLAQCETELRERDAEIAELTAKLRRLDALPELKMADLVAAENVRRGLTRVSAEHASATTAVEGARAALTAAEETRDAAVVVATREEAARRRTALDQRIDALSLAEDPTEAAFSLLDQDPRFEHFRSEVRELQDLVAPLGEEAGAVAGPWTAVSTSSPAAFYGALPKLALAAREAREAEAEGQRCAAEAAARRALEPAYVVDSEGTAHWIYTPEQAAKTHVPQHEIELAIRSPKRAIAMFDSKRLALLAAKDPRARDALDAGRRFNAVGIASEPPDVFRHRSVATQRADVEYDPINED